MVPFIFQGLTVNPIQRQSGFFQRSHSSFFVKAAYFIYKKRRKAIMFLSKYCWTMHLLDCNRTETPPALHPHPKKRNQKWRPIPLHHNSVLEKDRAVISLFQLPVLTFISFRWAEKELAPITRHKVTATSRAPCCKGAPHSTKEPLSDAELFKEMFQQQKHQLILWRVFPEVTIAAGEIKIKTWEVYPEPPRRTERLIYTWPWHESTLVLA